MKNNEETKLVKCVFCGSEDFTFVLKGYDYFYYCPLSFNLMRCCKCGQVCLNPPPQKKYVYYPAESYQKSAKRDIWLLLNPDRVRLVERFKKGKTILDIGCGMGEFLFDMKKHGWKIFGNDIFAQACAYATKEFALENIYNKDLLALDLPDNFFDVITLWHVIGHLQRPSETLKKINKILKDNGILIIETPNFESCQRKFFKGKWYALVIPYYIYHFTPKGLEKVLSHAGFEIFKKDYFVNQRSDFVTLKRSLLRWLRLERPMDEKGTNEAFVLFVLKKKCKIIFRLLRISFEIVCVALFLFLSLINCGNTFRIYCKKKG